MPLEIDKGKLAKPEKKPAKVQPAGSPKIDLTPSEIKLYDSLTANTSLQDPAQRGQPVTRNMLNNVLRITYDAQPQGLRDLLPYNEFHDNPQGWVKYMTPGFSQTDPSRYGNRLSMQDPQGPSAQGGSPLFGVPPGLTAANMQSSENLATMTQYSTGALNGVPGINAVPGLTQGGGTSGLVAGPGGTSFTQPNLGPASFTQPQAPAQPEVGIPAGYKGGKIGPHGEALPAGATAFTPSGTVWYGDAGTWKEAGSSLVFKDIWGYIKDAGANWWTAVKGDAADAGQWVENFALGEADYQSSAGAMSKFQFSAPKFAWSMSKEEREMRVQQELQNITASVELLGNGVHNLQQMPLGIGALSRMVGATFGVAFKVLNFGAPVKRVVGTLQGIARGYEFDESYMASRMATTNLFNTAAQDEYVSRYRAGENPVLLAMEMEDPMKEAIAEAILDPTLILLPVLKGVTGAKWLVTEARVFSKGFQVGAKTVETVMDVGKITDVAMAASKLDDSIEAAGLTIKAAKSIETEQRAVGFWKRLSSSKAALAQANLDTWFQIINKSFDKDLTAATRFIGHLTTYAAEGASKADRLKALEGIIEMSRSQGVAVESILSIVHSQSGLEGARMMGWFLQNAGGEISEGGRIGAMLKRAQQLDRMTPDELTAEVARVNEINKASGIKIEVPDKLALFMNDETTKGINQVMNDMYPSVLQRQVYQNRIKRLVGEAGTDAEKLANAIPAKLQPFVGDTISPRMVKVAQINENMRKVYAPVNHFFSQIYLAWNSAFAARNAMTNGVMVAVEGGPSALFGRPSTYAKMYTDIFGSVPKKAKSGFGQLGALIGKSGLDDPSKRAVPWWKKGFAQRWSEWAEENQSMQIHGKVFVKEMRRNSEALFTSIRKPLIDSGASADDIKQLEELVRENGYSVKKGLDAFFSSKPQERRTLGRLSSDDLKALDDFPGAREQVLDLLRTSGSEDEWSEGMADIYRRAKADADAVEYEVPTLDPAHPQAEEIATEFAEATEDGAPPVNRDIVEVKIQCHYASTTSAQHAKDQISAIAVQQTDALTRAGKLKPDEAVVLRTNITNADRNSSDVIRRIVDQEHKDATTLRAETLTKRDAAIVSGNADQVSMIWAEHFKQRDKIHREARIAFYEEVKKFVESEDVQKLGIDLSSWDEAIKTEMMASAADEMDTSVFLTRNRIVPKRNPELFGMLDEAGIPTRIQGINGPRLRSWSSLAGSVNGHVPDNVKKFSAEEIQAFHRMSASRKAEFAAACKAAKDNPTKTLTGDAEAIISLSRKGPGESQADIFINDAAGTVPIEQEAAPEVVSLFKDLQDVEFADGGGIEVKIVSSIREDAAARMAVDPSTKNYVATFRRGRVGSPQTIRTDALHEVGHAATGSWKAHASPTAPPAQKAFWKAMMPRMEAAFAQGKGKIGQVGVGRYPDAEVPWENLANGVAKYFDAPGDLDDDQFEIIHEILENSPVMRGMLERIDGLGSAPLTGEAVQWFTRVDPKNMPAIDDDVRRIAASIGMDGTKPDLTAEEVYAHVQVQAGRRAPNKTDISIQRGRNTASLHIRVEAPPVSKGSNALKIGDMTPDELVSRSDEIVESVGSDLKQMLQDRVPGAIKGSRVRVAGSKAFVEFDLEVANTADVDSVLSDVFRYVDESDLDGVEIVEEFDDLEFAREADEVAVALQRSIHMPDPPGYTGTWDVSFKADLDVALSPDEVQSVSDALEAGGWSARISSDGKSLEVMNVDSRYNGGGVQDAIDEAIAGAGGTDVGRGPATVRPVPIRRTTAVTTTAESLADGSAASSASLSSEFVYGARRRIPGLSYATADDLERVVKTDTAVSAAMKSKPHSTVSKAVKSKGGALYLDQSYFEMKNGARTFKMGAKDKAVLRVESKQALQVLYPDQKSIVVYVPMDRGQGNIGGLGGSVFMGRLQAAPPAPGVPFQAVEVPFSSVLSGSEWNPLLNGAGDESGHFMLVDLGASRPAGPEGLGVQVLRTYDGKINPRTVMAEAEAWYRKANPPTKAQVGTDLETFHRQVGVTPKKREQFVSMWDKVAAEREKARVVELYGSPEAAAKARASADMMESALIGDTEMDQIVQMLGKKYKIRGEKSIDIVRHLMDSTWSPQRPRSPWWIDRFMTEAKLSPDVQQSMDEMGLSIDEMAEFLNKEASQGSRMDAMQTVDPHHMPETSNQTAIEDFVNLNSPTIKDDMSPGPRDAVLHQMAAGQGDANKFYRLGSSNPSAAHAAAENQDGLTSLFQRIKDQMGTEYFGKGRDWRSARKAQVRANAMAPALEKALKNWVSEGSLNMRVALTDALGKADATRDFALLDYQGGKTGFDAVASYLFPYQFWYSRTYKNWARRALQKPWLITGYAHYRAYMSQKNAGMPDWWKYNTTVRIPGMDSPLYFNLESTLNPLYGLVGVDFDDEKRRRSGLAEWVDTAGKFGPSVWTPIQWGVALNEARRGDMEAASAWASRIFPQTAVIKGATSLLGIGPAGGLELDPLVWLQSGKIGQGETIYEQRRVVRALSELVQTGTLTEAQAIDVARTQSGPYWDMARDIAMKRRAGGYVAGGLLGVGFKSRTVEDIQIDSAYTNLYALKSQRSNMSPGEYRMAWQGLLERYPFLDVLLLGRRTTEEERNESYAWSVMARIPPGQSGYYSDLLKLDEDLLSQFYDDKGAIYGTDDGRIEAWNETDRMAFMSAMTNLGALLNIPPMTLRHEWTEAKVMYAQVAPTVLSQMSGVTDPKQLEEMQTQMDLMVDTYFALQAESPEKAKAWIKNFQPVQMYLDGKEKLLMGTPELFKYYGGLDFVERTWRGQMYDQAGKNYGEDIFMLQAAYFEIDAQGGDTRSFLAQYPQLREYWTWLRGEKAKIGQMLTEVGKYIPADPKALTRPDAVMEGILTSKALAELQSFNPDVERDSIVAQYTKYEAVENEDFSLTNFIDTEAERTWPGVLAKDQEWRRLVAENPLGAKAYFAANPDLQQFDKWSKDVRKKYNKEIAAAKPTTPTQMAQVMGWEQWNQVLSMGGAEYVSRLTVDSFRSGNMSDALRRRLKTTWQSIGRPMGSFDAWVAEMEKSWKASGSTY